MYHKQTVVYPYDGILFGHEKECTFVEIMVNVSKISHVDSVYPGMMWQGHFTSVILFP